MGNKRLHEHDASGERVVLVHIFFPAGKMEEDLNELKELALSANANVVATITGTRRVPVAKYFVGKGKAEEIRDAVSANHAELVIFNHVLSPAQERNLERLIQCRVLDRTRLILDIFARRARSFEGKLQVELAQLKHLATRLVRVWTHLERQQGGIGLRGPGETQLETDKRLIRDRIKLITERLVKLSKRREYGRRSREKAVLPTIALVGYTNAGKSTLFNQLTGASVYVANQLFATLDPTLRRSHIKTLESVIFADTVGFIRHLPHTLIQAFHATLEEVSQADLLLHVVDVNDDEKLAHIEEVKKVLDSIDAGTVPYIMVYNKIDLIPAIKPIIERDESHHIKRVFISAMKGWGITELVKAMSEIITKDSIEREIILTPKEAKLRAILYEKKAVISEHIADNGDYHLTVRLSQVEFKKLFR